MTILSNPDNFACELVRAGFRDPRIEHVTRDFELDVAALADPDKLLKMAPDWAGLNDAEKAAIVAEIHHLAGDRTVLPISSTALIAVAER